MKSLISFFTFLALKALSKIFYRLEVGWPEKKVQLDEMRMIILLNHTSLFEVLYISVLPVSFLRKLSKRMVAPAATKTLERPFVGFLFKLFSPGMMPITRKRDDTWHQFLASIYDDSIILFIPEGRMKRKNGLDLEGKKMTIKPGVVEILEGLNSGLIGMAYSGGLHHVQAPGEGFPKLFKTVKIDIEVFNIEEYKAMFSGDVGSLEWRKNVLDDLQHRLETKPPKLDDK